MKRQLPDIHDYSAGKYFRHLETLLGTKEIEKRLSRIERELSIESDIYLQEWVVPKRAWWRGFQDARKLMRRGGSFRRSITPNMEHPLQTAVKLSRLYSTMPDWKRQEFARRIVTDDDLNPTLFEIDCAANYRILGYDIRWCESLSTQGIRSPEFVVAAKNGLEFEVECKAKQADAGRRVEHRSFYRTVDHLIPIIKSGAFTGRVCLIVPDRLPNEPAWREEAAKALLEHISPGTNSLTLPGGEHFEWDLRPAHGSRIPIRKLEAQEKELASIYAHLAFFGERAQGFITDHIVFHLESAKRDAFLDRTLDSLKNANSKFTGTKAAIIFCFLPEIESFEGLQSDSAIKNMTGHFFEKHARNCVNAVTYVSDMRPEMHGSVKLFDMPSLTFRNHKYDDSLGANIPVYGSGKSDAARC